jgi:hypothetical protein
MKEDISSQLSAIRQGASSLLIADSPERTTTDHKHGYSEVTP